MSITKLDVRQSITRVLQDQINAASNITMDSTLAAINSELTPTGRLIAASTPSLVVTIGSGTVVNPNTSKNRVLPQISNISVSFTGGTITFPSATGTVTASPGNSATITIGANQFVAVLVQLSQTGNLNIIVGAAAASLGAVVIPNGISSLLSLGYIIVQSNGGSVIQNITNAMLYQFAGGGGSGSGSGSGSGKNYLSAYTASTSSGVANTGNGNFEANSTIGWSLAHSSLTSFFPSTVGSAGFSFSSAGGSHGGSAASGNLSISPVGVNQLAGSYSLSYVSSAATTAGDMLISDAFFIDKEDQAKAITFKFYYSAFSGSANDNFSGTNSNSFGIAVYDVTNAAWIQPAGIFGMTQGFGVGYVTGTFQSTSNSNQYQLAVYNANATSGATTLYFDDFSFGPQTAPFGPVVTDWTSYSLLITASPTSPTKGTIVTDMATYRRVGDSIEILYTFEQSAAGTAGSGNYLFSIPPGLTIDMNKVNVTSTPSNQGRGDFGNGTAYNGANFFTVQAYAADSTHIGLSRQDYTSSYFNIGSGALPLSNSGTIYSFTARFPIVGWSSNVQMSNDTDTRVVAARYNTSSSQSFAGGTDVILNFDTKDYDTHGAVTTGASWKFTAPVSGYYEISSNILSSSVSQADGANSFLSVYKNGSSNNVIAYWLTQVTQTLRMAIGGTSQIQLNAGDYISVTANSGSPGITLSGASSADWISIKRLSGPAVLAATDTIATKYALSATTAFLANTPIIFDAKSIDKTGSYNNITGIFTTPISGTYLVMATIQAVSGGEGIYVSTPEGIWYLCEPGSVANSVASGSTLVSLLAGDAVSIQSNAGLTIDGGGTSSHFSITRIGN